MRQGVAAAAPAVIPSLPTAPLVNHASLKFPAIPGVQSPAIIPGGYRADLGGPLTVAQMPFLVPRWTRTAMIRAASACPKSWSRQRPIPAGISATPPSARPRNLSPDRDIRALCRECAQREQNHDPRLSVEEAIPTGMPISRKSEQRQKAWSRIVSFWPRMWSRSSSMLRWFGIASPANRSPAYPRRSTEAGVRGDEVQASSRQKLT